MSTVPDEVHDGPETQHYHDNEEKEAVAGWVRQPLSGEAFNDEPDVEDGSSSPNSLSFKGYRKRTLKLRQRGIDSPPSSRDGHERQTSAEDSSSIPDDTPSIQGSIASSPGKGARPPSYSNSPAPSLRLFDRRFQAQLSSSQSGTPRAASPAFLTTHSRNSSAAWTLQDGKDTEVEVPWEVVRWTKLKKMTGQAFSEIGKRNFGRPTCIAVAAFIVLGTSKGIVLVFDYNQSIKCIMGPGSKAAEAGALTSVCISADHTTIAGGHASGSIFTWEVAKPARPFLHIATVDKERNPAVDGHLQDSAVLHLGFLGIRHTALSSADDKGMAFSHLATRGMGVVARAVKTTRILGRYPDRSTNASMSRKPSSVLSFSPLPLGNTEHAADGMGLVAMLTPYLLVIVSTMPIAQTQFKTPRPKEVPSHSAMTGAVAWFPSVKLKASSFSDSESASKAKLVYCWSNVLTVLDVIEVEPAENSNKAEPPSLQFKPRNRWKAGEAIVAVQWLSRSVLAVLTITQQLVVLEDCSMLVTDSSDLIQKHVYHTDLFSQQLNQLVDQLDDEEVASMHGVVADAFYMSFRAYKGRLFLLGHSEVSFGTLSNWADRLHAFVEEGSYLRAIRLATDYYNGASDKVTVGLPEDNASRHTLVREKLLEMISASLRYAFGQHANKASGHERRQHLEDLAQACIHACTSTGDFDYLFEEVYPWYQENDAVSIFLEELEPGIDRTDIKVLPPEVIKDFVNHYTSRRLSPRLEEMLCLLDPRTMDLDQVTNLCRANRLYDALLYVWNQALGDYTTILSELLQRGSLNSNGNAGQRASFEVERAADASKVFPYLSYILTGRTYPTAKEMDYDQANLAKADIYNFFFSGRGSDGIPRGDIGPLSPKNGARTNFPNLRKILNLDASSFVSMLNEAFEDEFLNGPQERLSNERPGALTEAQKFGLSVNRQWIVSILLEVMTPPSYESDETIYLDMFIARNLPKFPQFILLPGHVLQGVLVRLCNYPSDDIADDCQLSVEYLLSFYQPPDIQSLIPQLHEARFYRILKRVYRTEKQHAKLVEVCFEDHENQEEVFDCIADCLSPGAGLNGKQTEEIFAVLEGHAIELVSLDVTKAATIIERYAPQLHGTMLATISEDESRQFHYLQRVLEPEPAIDEQTAEKQSKASRAFIELYVRLMCRYHQAHVSTYVDLLETGDLRLDEVLPALESGEAIDAAVVLMTRDGKVPEAIDRLIKHMQKLETALLGLLESVDQKFDQESRSPACQEIVKTVQKYARVGVWVCQGQTHAAARSKPSVSRRKNGASQSVQLSLDEQLWLDLIDSVVTTVKNGSEVLERLERSEKVHEQQSSGLDVSQHLTALRGIVQETFTALLNATTTPQIGDNHRTDLSFLRILRAFLTRASLSSPSLSSLRGVLSAIFSAYSYEEGLLSLSNRLLDKDLFVKVTEAEKLRRRGWRPLGQVCEGCNKRVWGPGAGSQIWNEFQRSNEERRTARKQQAVDGARSARGTEDQSRSKGKAVTRKDREEQVAISEATAKEGKVEVGPGSGPIVVFACRHVFHRSCLERIRSVGDDGRDGRIGADGPLGALTCPLCV